MYMWNLSFQGSNLCPLRWKLRILTTGFSGNSRIFVFVKTSFRFIWICIFVTCVFCAYKKKIRKGKLVTVVLRPFSHSQFNPPLTSFPWRCPSFPQCHPLCASGAAACHLPTNPILHVSFQKVWIANFQSLPPSYRSSQVCWLMGLPSRTVMPPAMWVTEIVRHIQALKDGPR